MTLPQRHYDLNDTTNNTVILGHLWLPDVPPETVFLYACIQFIHKYEPLI